MRFFYKNNKKCKKTFFYIYETHKYELSQVNELLFNKYFGTCPFVQSLPCTIYAVQTNFHPSQGRVDRWLAKSLLAISFIHNFGQGHESHDRAIKFVSF